MLGAAVFILLDAPSLRTMSGAKSADRHRGVLHRAVHGLHCRRLDVAAISIRKMKRGRCDRYWGPNGLRTEQGKAEELIASAKALDEQVKALEVRLKALGGGQAKAERAGGHGAPRQRQAAPPETL